VASFVIQRAALGLAIAVIQAMASQHAGNTLQSVRTLRARVAYSFQVSESHSTDFVPKISLRMSWMRFSQVKHP
jgi:hypothetical protein